MRNFLFLMFFFISTIWSSNDITNDKEENLFKPPSLKTSPVDEYTLKPIELDDHYIVFKLSLYHGPIFKRIVALTDQLKVWTHTYNIDIALDDKRLFNDIPFDLSVQLFKNKDAGQLLQTWRKDNFLIGGISKLKIALINGLKSNTYRLEIYPISREDKVESS